MAPMIAKHAGDPARDEWRALHLIQEGAVTKVAGVYLHHDRPIPAELVAVFGEIAWAGWLSLAEGDPLWDHRPVSLTDAGAARHAALRKRYAEPDPLFGAIPTSSDAPSGHRHDAPAPGGEPGT
ncbi:MAG: hypothetical protein ACRDTG_21210 [Pseudonocardiaceae bacterium]